MRRIIVQPEDLTGSALAELKGWLGISRSQEDDLLIGLLRTSLAMCEAFTGQTPLSQVVEERIPVRAGRYPIVSRPVTQLLAAETIAPDGTRQALAPDGFVFDIHPAGDAALKLLDTREGQAVALRLQTGLATSWETVPANLRQGIIRLAAFYYRDRDRSGDAAAASTAPASVTALWRPWRSVRLT